MLRAISMIAMLLVASTALAGDKEDAERLMEKVFGLGPKCYSMKVIRPVNPPTRAKGFVPLAPGLRNDTGGNVTYLCSEPGSQQKVEPRK